MNIESDKEKIIFKKEIDGKTLYSIGLSHKKQDGNWENGYMSCKFQKDTNIADKTKIKIIQAWLDFYIKDKKTYPYVFINKYEIVQENKQDVPQNTKTEYDNIQTDIKLEDSDLPF